jgi:asparagine synthase (glutamine-hydrolysing)
MGTIWNYEMNIHLQRILIKMDRASMYHSLEARVPYLSNGILYIAAHTEWQDCVKGKKGKLNIKQIVATHTGEEFVNNKKQGFLVPMRYWLRNELKDDVIDKVMNMPPELSACFNKKQLRKMLHGHIELNKDYSGIIWAVYSLVNWYNHHRHSYKKTFQ